MVLYNFAYVKFRNDEETAIVDVKDIKNFDQDSHHEDKCYMVGWKKRPAKAGAADTCTAKAKKIKRTFGFAVSKSKNKCQENGVDEGSLPDVNTAVTVTEEETPKQYYKAQILLLDETKEKLEERIKGGGKRIRIPKITDSSVEESSVEEEEEMEMDESVEELQENLKRKFGEVRVAKKQNIAKTAAAKTSALHLILEEKLGKRKVDALQQQSTCKHCPGLKRQVAVLEEEKRKNQKEMEELRSLNRKLQRDVLNKLGPLMNNESLMTPSAPKPAKPRVLFATPHVASTSSGKHQMAPLNIAQKTPPAQQPEMMTPAHQAQMASSPNQALSGGEYEVEGGEVSLGAGIAIPDFKIKAITSQVKNSLMVKNLAVAVWGSAVLRESSVTGTTCNRYKDHAARPGLDPAKLQAVKAFFAHHLKQQPLSLEANKKELSKFNGYIREKIADIRKY